MDNLLVIIPILISYLIYRRLKLGIMGCLNFTANRCDKVLELYSDALTMYNCVQIDTRLKKLEDEKEKKV